MANYSTPSKSRHKLRTVEIIRHFTKSGIDPFTQVEWGQRVCHIQGPQGQKIFQQDHIEAPSNWSQLAVDIAASKYFRGPKEKSVRQLILRVVQSFKHLKIANAQILADELAHILLHQKAAFNSPVWFNLGLYKAYGMKGQSGHWRFDPQAQKALLVSEFYQYPQTSACFIQSIDDDLMSIFDLVKKEARIFKFGSGTGTNFSPLRSRYEALENGGYSSGLMSFLEVLDKGAGATKSGGTVRRAAKMVCLDIDHPEIEEFIDWKVREEKKARILAQAGYGYGFEDEAYRTVSGQNSNNSVRVSDEFMQALQKNGEWATRLRTTGEVHQKFKAQELWSKLTEAAWECADPGVQFSSTIASWHTCPQSGPIRASNPCSEYMFLDDTACNLASVNLVSFLKEDGAFLIDDFLFVCRALIIAQDQLVGMSSYPTEKIAENSYRFRPLGLGYANLGGFLMRQAIGYGSDEAAEWTAWLTATMQAQALFTSTELAKSFGAFTEFKMNRESMLAVLHRQQQAYEQFEFSYLPKAQIEKTKHIWRQALDQGEKFGFRNSQVTAIAPTGTIGLFMDCDTTGIEPDFSLVKFKKMAGGGMVKMNNQSVPLALKRLKYSSGEVQDILKYLEQTSTVEGAPHLRAEHLPVFDCANRCGHRGERVLTWQEHLKIVAAAQPFISGAISKTVNLPQESQVKDVAAIYLKAWELGLKAISIYRDGSKVSQPLSQQSDAKVDMMEEYIGSVMGTPSCVECGHKTVLAGTCFKCLNCGHTTSC